MESIPGGPFYYRTPSKHLRAEKIPPVFRTLSIVGILRDPLRRFESQYRFGDWLHFRGQYPGVERGARFPDIDFPEFVRLANERLWLTGRIGDSLRRQEIGWQTGCFLYWYCDSTYLDRVAAGCTVEPDEVINNVLVDRFLRTSCLAPDLADLVAQGPGAPKAAEIRQLVPLRPMGGEFSYRPVLPEEPDPDTIARIRHCERVLIDVFVLLKLHAELDDRMHPGDVGKSATKGGII
jgi:hypothetical protein